jgi:hypothetical protein
MIKKLLSLYFFTALISIGNSFGQASCTPNFSCLSGTATEGICPDSTTGLPAGVINVAYSTSMSIKIPSSYTYMGTTYAFSHFAVTDVTVDTSISGNGSYVPLSVIGLSYMGNGVNSLGSSFNIVGYTMTNYCYWTAPGSGCVVVSGTPTISGSFPVSIQSQVRANIGIGFAWLPAPENTDYRIVINTPAGVETAGSVKFEVKQNTPNPFNLKTEIPFISASSSDVDFKVYNMLGKVVFARTIKAEKGNNEIELDAASFAPGIYVYSIKNGENTVTKRMIVSNK